MDRRVAGAGVVFVSILTLWAYATGRLQAVWAALQDPGSVKRVQAGPGPAGAPGSGSASGPAPLPDVGGESVRDVRVRRRSDGEEIRVRVDSRSPACREIVSGLGRTAGLSADEIRILQDRVCR